VVAVGLSAVSSDEDASMGILKSRGLGSLVGLGEGKPRPRRGPLGSCAVVWPLVERLQRQLEATETGSSGEGLRHTRTG
jgi:hypothetical protein